MKRKNVSLTHIKAYHVIKALSEGDQIDRWDGMSSVDVAKILTKELGFPVSSASVLHIVNDLDLKWHPKWRKLARPSKKEDKVAELEAKVEQLEGDLTTLVDLFLGATTGYNTSRETSEALAEMAERMGLAS